MAGVLGLLLALPALCAADTSPFHDPISTGMRAQSWSVPDLDGDRVPEAARARQLGWDLAGYAHSLELQLSGGAVRQSFEIHTAGPAPLSFAFRDLDGDLDLDMIVTSGVFHKIVGVWLNEGGNLKPVSVDQFAGSVKQTDHSFERPVSYGFSLTFLPNRGVAPALLFASIHPARVPPASRLYANVSAAPLAPASRLNSSRAPPASL